jgi:hypothetical protein
VPEPEVATSQLPERAPSRARAFGLRADDELDGFPEPEWVIEGMLPAGGLGMLVGTPESGKTFFALDMALSVALGLPWHGRATQQGPVVYVAAEGIHSLKHRVAAWKHVHDVEARAGVYFVPRAVQLVDPEEISNLVSDIGGGIGGSQRLVVFDTLQRCMAGKDENSQIDAGAVIANLDWIRRMTDATCLLIHHPGVEGQRPRGSTVFMGAMDTAWLLRDDDGTRVLECKKQKDAPHFDDMRFVLQPVMQSCVVAHLEGPTSLTRGLTRNQRRCLETVRDVDTGTGVPSGVWLDASGLPRASFHRTVKQLVDAGYVSGGRRRNYGLSPTGLDVLSQVSQRLRKVS